MASAEPFLWAEQPRLWGCFPRRGAPALSFFVSSLGSLQQLQALLSWPPKLGPAPGGILEEHKSTKICLGLLAMLLVMLPRLWLVLWAVSEHSYLTVVPFPLHPPLCPCSPRSPRPGLLSLLLWPCPQTCPQLWPRAQPLLGIPLIPFWCYIAPFPTCYSISSICHMIINWSITLFMC